MAPVKLIKPLLQGGWAKQQLVMDCCLGVLLGLFQTEDPY